MSVADHAQGGIGAENGFLSREHTVAKPGFNRWLVPPAALCTHLAIGMAYALSVFWKPLAAAIPGAEVCKNVGFFELLTTTSCNWPDSVTIVTFEIGIVILGISAALFGGWLEKAGPRKAGLVAALFWGGGFLVSAVAVKIHQLWLLYLGLGLFGGIGLGIGYITPVSTLIKWFPDRRGMATGMAIMGFGGGAMIGAPLANLLMAGGTVASWPTSVIIHDLFYDWHNVSMSTVFPTWSAWTVPGFKSAAGPGVFEAFVTLGILYFVVMTIGALLYRVPPENWVPEGWTAPAKKSALISHGHVHLDDAHKTFSFWMIWAVLFLNVTAGISVLSIASPMLQTIFGPTLIGLTQGTKPSPDQLKAIAAVAAGFVGLLSLFNIVGRFFWASTSDKIGRKVTYATFFTLGILLYAAVPTLADAGQKALFVGALCIILSMYGGGFATVPAYLADIFGTKFVGAIHGRLLTAWSAAGVVGSEVIVRVRDAQIAAGVPKTQVYDAVMYIMAGLLAVGFICNLLVRPVDKKWHMTGSDVADAAPTASTGSSQGIGRGSLSGATLIPWLIIAIPVAWGLYKAILSAMKILT